MRELLEAACEALPRGLMLLSGPRGLQASRPLSVIGVTLKALRVVVEVLLAGRGAEARGVADGLAAVDDAGLFSFFPGPVILGLLKALSLTVVGDDDD